MNQKKLIPKKNHNSQTNITIEGIVSLLSKHNHFLFFLHENPDADAIGSNLALVNTLNSIGKEAYIVSSDNIPSSLQFLTNNTKRFSIEDLPDGFVPDFYGSCDVASPSQLGKYKHLSQEFVLSIDHHAIHDSFAKYRYVDSTASSAAEIVYKIITKLNPHSKISKENASLLYAAITADTGGFRYSNTTSSTHIIAAKLLGLGADHIEICQKLFETKTLKAINAEEYALTNVKLYSNGKIAYIKITEKERLENDFSIEDEYDVINVIRKIEGVKISIFAREKQDGLFKISTRSSCGINVAAICAKFNGGGHSGAAGCTVKRENVDYTVKAIMEECKLEF